MHLTLRKKLKCSTSKSKGFILKIKGCIMMGNIGSTNFISGSLPVRIFIKNKEKGQALLFQKALELVARVQTTKAELALARLISMAYRKQKFGDEFVFEKEIEMQHIEIQRLHSENQRLYHDGKYLQHQLYLRELAYEDLHKEQGKRTSVVIQKALELVARVQTTEAELALARKRKFGDAFVLEKEIEMQHIEIQRLHSKNQRLYHDGKYLQHQLHLRELAYEDLHKEQGKRTNVVIQKALELVARVWTTEAELALPRDAASRHQEENIALKKALEEAQKLLGEGFSGDH